MKRNETLTEKEILLRKELMCFRCLYQQGGEINKRQFWSGSMIRSYDHGRLFKEGKAYSSIEGHLSEFQTHIDWSSGLRFPEDRYLLGVDGIIHSDGSLKFTIYPKQGRPIDYMFRYDEEDNIFYGVWFFVNTKTIESEYGGFARLDVEKYRGANEREKYAIEQSCWNIDAYFNNMEDITNMVDKSLSTLLPHEEVDDSIYANAKKYFKNNEKTLRLIFTCEGD